jgi:hypothetical protein
MVTYDFKLDMVVKVVALSLPGYLSLHTQAGLIILDWLN